MIQNDYKLLFPFEIKSQWLPPFGSRSYIIFFSELLKKEPSPLHPSVKALGGAIKKDKTLL